VVAVILSGGPRPFLRHVEDVLDAMVRWVRALL
jgi:hypothetical protein